MHFSPTIAGVLTLPVPMLLFKPRPRVPYAPDQSHDLGFHMSTRTKETQRERVPCAVLRAPCSVRRALLRIGNDRDFRIELN